MIDTSLTPCLARLREVTKPFGLFARLKSPIEFDAIDEQPVNLVFLLLLPAASQLDQLNALAAVARRLRQTDVLDRLRGATSRAELDRALTEGAKRMTLDLGTADQRTAVLATIFP